MYLRSISVYCRLCGAQKPFRLDRKPSVLGGYRYSRVIKNDGVSVDIKRSFSEKNRDPKSSRWVTGRPDDPPRKNRPSTVGRLDTQSRSDQEEKSSSKVKASDVANPEKWTGWPEGLGKQKPCISPKAKTEKMTEHKFSPQSGLANFSGAAKEIKASSTSMSAEGSNKMSSPSLSAVRAGSTERPTPPAVTSALLEEVRSLNQRQPPCLEGTKTAVEEKHIEPSSASVSATQFNMTRQNMPELLSGTQFSDQKNNFVLTASKDQTSPPPSGLAPSQPNLERNLNKFNAIAGVKLRNSSLKNHLLGTQKEKKSGDIPEKPGKGRRIDITVSKLPPLKVVRQTFNEEDRHRIYSFGLAETGALGFHKPNECRRWRKYMARPLRHQFAEENRVISAESGYGFTLFYVRNDSPIKMYGCGINTEFQLGPTDKEVVTYPSPIDIRISSPKTKVVSFSAGRAHSVVATDKEGVFLFGSNSYGQCGRAIEEEDGSSGCTITQIKGFGGEKAVTVACGQDHTCFVTESGKVYACGWGSEGQTGQGHCMHVAEPCLVTGEIGSEKIVKIAGKCDTVLALSDKGNLFGWGSNEFKQLRDDPDIAQVDIPVALEHVHRKCGKIIDIAAGSSFCLVLNQEGDVYVWGYGILGAGPELVKTSVPTLLPRTLFGANDYHPWTVPSKVFCGVDHLAVVNSLKHVYAWGKNKHGCLGIGNSRDQYFPYKLAISADAVHVSCAVDHSVVVTDHE